MSTSTSFPFSGELARHIKDGSAKRATQIEEPPVKGWAITCIDNGTTLLPNEDPAALDAEIAKVRAESPHPDCVHWRECWVHFQEKWGPFVVNRMHHTPRDK